MSEIVPTDVALVDVEQAVHVSVKVADVALTTGQLPFQAGGELPPEVLEIVARLPRPRTLLQEFVAQDTVMSPDELAILDGVYDSSFAMPAI